MSQIVVVATLTAQPDKADEVQELLSGLLEPVHAEDGNVLYALHRGIDDPARFVFVEVWESKDALKVHGKQPHMADVLSKAGPLLASPPDIARLQAVPGGDAAKGSLAG